MDTSPRAQPSRTLYAELRSMLGSAPRRDAETLLRVRGVLRELRTDPYASAQFHERLDNLHRRFEQWFNASGVDTAAIGGLREAIVVDMAHLETEQRLRSWLMDIVR